MVAIYGTVNHLVENVQRAFTKRLRLSSFSIIHFYLIKRHWKCATLFYKETVPAQHLKLLYGKRLSDLDLKPLEQRSLVVISRSIFKSLMVQLYWILLSFVRTISRYHQYICKQCVKQYVNMFHVFITFLSIVIMCNKLWYICWIFDKKNLWSIFSDTTKKTDTCQFINQ